ncbi:deoxyguanosinetriphosphate triphosphohydrolase family protein [Psychrosphaera sp. F3M07]|jgi:dGTPase|uniref:anti-phage deoxyguanosine triphosphatase n=1 Tax=Psychrosphaera sp. F3M07 TaxID=2841560 RepID=UPI001C088E63|nr:anti-phage deoxyguanosine triphosphatase [Psychrosphaera sp. F3M07]MBU2918646.1 deoxyguanosinetriphosphate triphosphohydrolase family protein [Psychrosphaera sp. F3M07]
MNKWQARLSGDRNVRPNDHRDAFQRDRARVLHSAAFRRLQSKTQILSVGKNDFYRTRLTHSLEVAQIGTGLTAQLRQSTQVLASPLLQALLPSDALIESLCLAHDLGHPPFGHGGEVALHYMMRDSGGFEANGQTFRIATELEPYTKSFGMDLTRRTLLGLIKYPRLLDAPTPSNIEENGMYLIKAADWKPTKGIFIDDGKSFDWVLKDLTEPDRQLLLTLNNNATVYKSFDASIMELADDIAYGVHDLEDAIVLNNVTKEKWLDQVLPILLEIENPWSKKHSANLTEMLFSHEHHLRKNAIGALVNHLITNITIIEVNPAFTEPLLKYNATLVDSAMALLDVLKKFVFNNVIMATQIQQLEFKGQRMLMAMFDAFKSDPLRLLPNSIKQEWINADSKGNNPDRILSDYLASMSDEHATRVYQNLFSPI